MTPNPQDVKAWLLALQDRIISALEDVDGKPFLRDAWERGQELAVHGWIYGLQNGLLRDLQISVQAPAEILPAYNKAISALTSP